MRPSLRPIAAASVALALAGACIAVPEGEGIPPRITDRDDASADAFLVVEASPSQDASSEPPVADPHALIGVDPAHGPYAGGRLAVVRGNGFSSALRVWFGDAQVPAEDITPADPTRAQVVVPPGPPGEVNVRVQNGDDASTARVLLGGYTYEPFYAEPSTGPTSGGTLVRIFGKDTAWNQATEVRMGDKPCLTLEVVSAEELACAIPPSPAGTVPLSVTQQGEPPTTVYDAFTYADTDNGYKGGLSGAALHGSLKVAVYDAYKGDPIAGAVVVAGDNVETALVQTTGGAGVAIFQDQGLQTKRSVTVAAECFEPTTFVDVPVDTVTAYLVPIITPACSPDSGDVPPVGGKGSNPATIRGELVWRGGTEFKRAPWTNVPAPKTGQEQLAAYLFQPTSDPTGTFALPDAASAVRPDADGSIGYSFQMASGAGTLTLYALAGIENRSVAPATFTAYAFGVVRGVSATPGSLTSDVFIQMDKPLDQAVVLSATPPLPGPKGPDRLIASVAVQLGTDRYAVFPRGTRTVPIGATGSMSFVGLPGLDGLLAGARFVSSARAVTGANLGAPLSIVGRYLTTDTSIPVHVEGFVQVPVLTAPSAAKPFDGRHLAVQYAPGGAFVDVNVFRIDAGAGMVTWLVVAPGSKTSIELPDLEALGVGLPRGPVSLSVYGGHIADGGFDYGALLYRHMDQRGWIAYAQDVFNTYY